MGLRNPYTGRWPSPPCEGLLVYAQRLEEGLSDFTSDSYKARTLNAHTRAQELSHAVQSVRRGDMARRLLRPLIEETVWSLQNDAGAQRALGSHSRILTQDALWFADDLHALAARSELLRAILGDHYEKALISILQETIPAGREKEAIQSAGLNLALEWMRRGYARDYIYFRTRQFFFAREGPPLDPDPTGCLQSFFRWFTGETATWRVYLRVSEDLRKVGPMVQSEFFKIVTRKELPTPNDQHSRRFAEGHRGSFGLMNGVEALDPQAAADEAVRRIQVLATFASLHDHRSDFAVDGAAWVWNEKGEGVALKPRKEPVHKQPGSSGSGLVARLGPSFTRLGPTELPPESWIRIMSALRFHAMAVKSRTPEEQLLALWVSLEALLPLREAESRISKVTEVAVPILSRRYPSKLMKILQRDLKRAANDLYETALRMVPRCSTEFARFTLLVSGAEYQDARNHLFANMTQSPLLKNRLYSVSEACLDAARMKRTVRAHEERVRWNIYRIYRARNFIVHAGYGPPFAVALVENLHAYVLRIVHLLEESLSKDTVPPSLDAALLKIIMDHRAHMDILERAGPQSATVETVEEMVFGPT